VPMDDMDSFENLVKAVASLGVQRLTDILGRDRCEILHELQEEIVSSTLARSIVLKNGVDLLSDQKIRRELLDQVDVRQLKSVLNCDDVTSGLLDSVSRFSWGSNKRSKEFLSIIRVSEDLVSSSDVNKSPASSLTRPKQPLYAYQNWIRKQLVQFLTNSPDKRTIVHMPTGSGKTRTSMEAICDALRSRQEVGQNVVWMAHSEELCEQAAQTFEELWCRLGSTPANMIRLWGGRSPEKIDESSINFVITSFQTAHKMTTASSNARFSLFSSVRRNCTILVVDEAHQSVAPTYQSAIELFSNQSTKLVGLTATPGRSGVEQTSEEDRALAEFYNLNKIDIVDNDGKPLENPIEFLQSEEVLAKIDHKIWGGSTVQLSQSELQCIENRLDLPGTVLGRVAADHQRTIQIVVNTMKLAIEDGLQTILFAPTKENAIDIALILNLRNCKARAVTSDTNSNERQQFISQFKSGDLKVLTNFGVLTTGFDAPNIQAVVIARPTTSVVLYSQMIGRGLRGPRMGGSEKCVVVDVQDNINNLPDAQNAFRHFDQFYH
jgi:DNA repair protein RadD